MSIQFSAGEVFEMAEQIERNGVKFYKSAAKNARNEGVKNLLIEMSETEASHEQTFIEMRKELTAEEEAKTVFDPDNEIVYYLQAISDSHGWEGMAAPEMELTGHESIDEILNCAIKAERGSIEFYLGMEESVSARHGKEKIRAVIREEMSHVAMLQKKLNELK
ncbi:MAG: ferritin family protein [Planctomycetota bacterium]